MGTVAHVLQDWVLDCMATGDTNGLSVPRIPVYGENWLTGLLSDKCLGLLAIDAAGLERCDFGQKGAVR
jgi:hypothetical protein